MKHLYTITDENNASASEYVSSSRALNQAELLVLKDCMSIAKKQADADDRLYTIVTEGVDLFHERTGRHLTIIDDPVSGYITI